MKPHPAFLDRDLELGNVIGSYVFCHIDIDIIQAQTDHGRIAQKDITGDQIWSCLHNLAYKNNKITFQWIPSYIGLGGNDKKK